MTSMDRRDRTPDDMGLQAAREALDDAGLTPTDISLVVFANATGGRLWNQGCIRGQTWLRELGLGGAGIVNVDNSCAGGSTAMHLGYLTAQSTDGPVLVLGVEKMWTGLRGETLAGIEDGLPKEERAAMHATLDNPAGSILMGLNATWLYKQMEERDTTVEQVAATAVKARRCAARNPLAQYHTEVTLEEVLASPTVAGPLTRLMCSSFTDGAAAAILTTQSIPGAPSILASVIRSGNGDSEYHARLGATAEEAWKIAGVGPSDLDLLELHDATSAEELYALESLGVFAPGDAGPATVAGATDIGSPGVCVNTSGGLVGRGHPLGATGVAQVVEIATHLRDRAGARQVVGARIGAAVNTGGIIGGDVALAAVHVLARA
jgi:acetyl-CoA acetyltransferase